MTGADRAEWRSLDAAGDPQRLLTFLDAFTAIPEVAAAKRRSMELLDAHAGSRVLDVGCGTGADAVALAASVQPGGEVIGVDSSQLAITAAEARVAGAQGLTFQQADAAALPFPDASFDAVRADRVIQHVERPEVVAAELGRVTRGGGVIVVTEVTFLPGPATEVDAGAKAKELLPFIPYILRQAGVSQTRFESAEVATEAGANVAEVLGLKPGRITLRIVHFSGRKDG